MSDASSAAPPAPRAVPQTGIGVQFERALALHQQGRLPEARLLYEEIVGSMPAHADALHMLGVLASQTQDPARAVEFISRAIREGPGNALCHYNRGAALQALERWEPALADYSAAIALEPRLAEAHCNRAALLRKLGRSGAALDSADEAIRLRTEFVEAHVNRALALEDLGRWAEALAARERVTSLRPAEAEGFARRGQAEERLQRWAAAAASYARAIELRPDDAVAHLYRGNVLMKLGQPGAALGAYDAALRLQPTFAAAVCSRAAALFDLGRAADALIDIDRALRLDPRFAQAHFNRGNVLASLERYEEAIGSYDRAIEFKGDYAEACCNRGLALIKCNRTREALASYDAAIRLQPDYSQALYNRAFAWLLIGELRRAWPDHERRWAGVNGASREAPRQFREPAWTGVEPISGARILLYAEQGLGDTLQFSRFVERVVDLGATVILEVQAPLTDLLRSLPGISHVVARGEPLPAFDYRCALLSLPLAFGTDLKNIPRSQGYLKADAASVARWNDQLQSAFGSPRRRVRVGLVWSGAALPDPNRSVALSALMDSLPADCDYVGLTKEIRDADRATLASRPEIRDVSGELRDFGETAAVCACLDLIISVDTSVAHLAGALGRPTWVLLPFHPDWRWSLDRSDSPWYASVRLYRQAARGDWRVPLERVAADLRRAIADRGALTRPAEGVA